MTSPIGNVQASLALTVFQQINGVYPSRDPGSFIGELGIFAGNFGPDGAPLASGQFLSIAQNTALFSLLGTTYGGNGMTNFELPNLNGTALIGAGQGLGLPLQNLGAETGASEVMLTQQQLPPDLSGTSQGFDNYQPSLPVSYIINTSGVFPAPDGGGGLDFMGEVVPFAGNFAPAGWAFADGSLLPIASNDALFNLIGTTYGGDGETNFALPDLRGRDIVGASASDPIGTSFGHATISLTNAQVPTSPGGSAQPFDNQQPSLALTYLIALQGIYPTRDGAGAVDPNNPYLGQIVAFAGNFAPNGWAVASGQLLSINQNQALFSLLGTTFGGNGLTTFALPNLNDRTVVGTSADAPLGTAFGSNIVTINSSQVPPPILSGQLALSTIMEDATTNGTVATFTDSNLVDTTSAFTASVNWGDGTTETGTVTGSNGSFAVSVPGSTHVYADEGSIQPVVTITRTADNDQIAPTGTVTVTESDVLTPSGMTFNAIPGLAFNGTVATFTDSNVNNVASDFTATIDWGDGTTSVGAVTDVAGAIGVSGTHTYAAPGADTVVVTLSDDAPGTATATATSMAQVTQPLSGQVVLTSISEGTATTGVVATFSDANTSDVAGNFAAAVDWGDCTTEVGAVAGSNGSFAVSVPGSTHFYADEANVQPVVTITRTTDNDQIAPTGTVTVTEGDVLMPQGMTFSVQQGQAFNGTVATFTDSNVNNVASDFVATIDWGDGTASVGTVTDEAGAIGVSGTHTYMASGTDTVTVTLTEDAPGTATATATSTADITPCYCEGTLILTDRGEVPVETLVIGDRVITADGVARPIRWIGRRSYAGRFARGTHVLPICFKAGALDVNSPRRDLWVSPHHAMFLDGVLIEALDLINGVSIIQAERVERVDYFHIELDAHDIIIAEGALSESFVDDDSRGMFQNAQEFAAIYPDRPTLPARYCAPRVAFGTELEAVRREIAHRAGIPYRRPAAESRPRALVVDSRLPQVGHDGGANAVLDHTRALQAAGFEVSFLALDDRRRETSALRSLGVTPLSLPPSGLFTDVARAHAGVFDLIYLHRVENAVRCLKVARRYFDAHIVYSVADLHHLRIKAQSEFEPEHASELMCQAQIFALQEIAGALSADCVITHSESEAENLEQIVSIAAERKVRVVPWTVPVAAVRKPFVDRSGVAFIGNFAHAPNIGAACWLVDEIMPLVWETDPDLPCLIAGSDMSEELHHQLTRPGVRVLGHVERLGEVFEQARLTVAPLRFGAGLKDKVIRSMAAGLPCVGTSEAFDGMQGLPVAISDTCRCDTAGGLAAAIIRMHGDEAANARCEQAGLEYIGVFYNEARVNALIHELAQPALDRFRAKVKSKSECEVLQFAPAPRLAEETIATRAGSRERRIVFN